MEAKIVNSVGLLLSIVGGCMWFFYGFPQPTHEDSVGLALEDNTPLEDGRTVAQHNEEVRKTKAKYRRISQMAPALIILGFLCQLVAIWM